MRLIGCWTCVLNLRSVRLLREWICLRQDQGWQCFLVLHSQVWYRWVLSCFLICTYWKSIVNTNWFGCSGEKIAYIVSMSLVNNCFIWFHFKLHTPNCGKSWFKYCRRLSMFRKWIKEAIWCEFFMPNWLMKFVERYDAVIFRRCNNLLWKFSSSIKDFAIAQLLLSFPFIGFIILY